MVKDTGSVGTRVIHHAPNVTTVYFDNVVSGFSKWVLLRSDAHHDSIYCDRKHEKDDLDKVAELDAFVIDVGDLFDACNGKYDPRRTFESLRPEYKVDNYLDEIVTDAARFYGPYAKHFLCLAPGNHESSILKNNGVNLTDNLVHRLNSDYGSKIQRGGYGGYVRFMFTGNRAYKKTLKYFHGSGMGNGLASIGKQSMIYPDADIVVNGHSHQGWYFPLKRERVSDRGTVTTDIQHHIRTHAYIDNYRDGSEGWHVEAGGKPQPIGAVWMRLSLEGHEIKIEVNHSVR